jgi:8-oxo-dGTP pyrophosphatase MutT (NUDIX family)
MPRPVRVLAWLVFKNEENVAVSRATALRKQMLAPLGASSAINTFQWSKAWLTIEHPASMSTVQRFEADSKFFRSFSVVVAVLIVVVAWRGADVLWPRWSIIVLVLLLGGSLWRFMELRLKSTNQAYWSVLTVAATKGIEATAPTKADTASHAGGVVLREHGGVVQCVLVGSTDDPEQLVLPKGKIRPGENARVAATREVREEAGQWARIDRELDVATYDVGDSEVTVRVYLMDSLGSTRATDRFRRVEWVPLVEAIGQRPIDREPDHPGRRRALHLETLAVLRAAATARGIAFEER